MNNSHNWESLVFGIKYLGSKDLNILVEFPEFLPTYQESFW